MLAPKKFHGEPGMPHMKVIHKNISPPIITTDIIDELIQYKRDKRRREKRNSMLFFSIGMFITMLAVVAIFEWKSYQDPEVIDFETIAKVNDELLDIPPTEQAPPEPPKVLQQPNFTVVEEEVVIEELNISLDIDVTEETRIQEPISVAIEEPEEEIAQEIFTIVEQQPMPEGGMQAYLNYIATNIKYPSSALRLGVQGKVFVQFVVLQNGSLSDIQILRGIGAGCDEEAIRVIQAGPKWNAGKQRGRPVKVRMVLPVFFMLRTE